jgi:signal recognition particle receptor subunit beta
MALVNQDTKEVQFKIVYCGGAFAGKTTNLHHIHARIDDPHRGSLQSMAASSARDLFFDYLPIAPVLIRGYHTRFNLFTVPSTAKSEASRQLILRGADGIVFVVDGAKPISAAKEEMDRLRCSLEANGQDWESFPRIIQLNKIDHPLPFGSLRHEEWPKMFLPDEKWILAVASQGYNVFATLNTVAEEALQRFHDGLAASDGDLSSFRHHESGIKS